MRRSLKGEQMKVKDNKYILQLEKNTAGKDFVCGDIHGCFDDLEEELIKVQFNKSADRLFCVGDLIDRGPKSELAADYLKTNWFYSVMGNHENLFLMGNQYYNPEWRYYLGDYLRNGGRWAYETLPEKSKVLLDSIKNLPLIIRIEDTIITHAALPKTESLEEIEKNLRQYMDTLLWYRGKYPPVMIPGINTVYVGHSIVKEPKQSDKYINIDTGAFLRHRGLGGKLTLLMLGERNLDRLFREYNGK